MGLGTILGVLTSVVADSAGLLKEVMQMLNPMPTAVKVILFLLMLQIIFPVLNAVLCPATINNTFLGVTIKQDFAWCINPEFMTSYDSVGNPIAGTGIRLFSSEMALIWTFLFIGYYIFTIGVKYWGWLGV